MDIRPQIAYDTRPYRKQQHQQNRLKPSMLPIGDPAVLWRHTVCLNAVIHRLRYTLTVAVCARVPRKSSAVAVTDYCYQYGDEGDCRDGNVEGFEFDDGQDREYDLQLLSRHVHVSISDTLQALFIKSRAMVYSNFKRIVDIFCHYGVHNKKTRPKQR